MSKLLIALLGLSAVLILCGLSLLFGRPSSVLPLPAAQSEASVAYSSQLVLAYDAATSSADVVAPVGGILVLAGLMVSAAALGRRLAKAVPNAG